MNKQLEGVWVAIVVTDGFEQDELVKPRLASARKMIEELAESRQEVRELCRQG